MAQGTRGLGSVYRRGDGRWCAALVIGTRRRVLYGKTRREVQEKLASLQQGALTGASTESSRLTVAQYLDQWMAAAGPHLGVGSAALYEDLLRLHVVPVLGPLRLQALRPLHIVRWHAERGERGVPRRRLQMAHRVLQKALGDAVKWRLLTANPAIDVEPPRPKRLERKIWTEQQASRFLQTILQREWAWDPFWAFLIGSGCRRGEALGLRWTDIDWQRGSVNIVRAVTRVRNRPVVGDVKTTCGRRTIILPLFALGALEIQQQRQATRRLSAGAAWIGEDYVFTTGTGSHPYPAHLHRALRAACRDARVPVIHIHGLRHVHATLAVRAGADLKSLQRRLGHASLTMTLGLYAHALASGDAATAQALERMLTPPAIQATENPGTSSPLPARSQSHSGRGRAGSAPARQPRIERTARGWAVSGPSDMLAGDAGQCSGVRLRQPRRIAV